MGKKYNLNLYFINENKSDEIPALVLIYVTKFLTLFDFE